VIGYYALASGAVTVASAHGRFQTDMRIQSLSPCWLGWPWTSRGSGNGMGRALFATPWAGHSCRPAHWHSRNLVHAISEAAPELLILDSVSSQALVSPLMLDGHHSGRRARGTSFIAQSFAGAIRASAFRVGVTGVAMKPLLASAAPRVLDPAAAERH